MNVSFPPTPVSSPQFGLRRSGLAALAAAAAMGVSACTSSPAPSAVDKLDIACQTQTTDECLETARTKLNHEDDTVRRWALDKVLSAESVSLQEKLRIFSDIVTDPQATSDALPHIWPLRKQAPLEAQVLLADIYIHKPYRGQPHPNAEGSIVLITPPEYHPAAVAFQEWAKDNL